MAAAQKHNMPALRFSEFSGEWLNTELEKIGRVIRGASPRPKGDSRYYGGNVPRLMVKDVTRDGKYVTPSIDYLTEEGAKLSRPCKAGTLIIVCSGTVGIVSFLNIDACIHDGFLALVNIDQSKIYDDFLYHQLSTLRERFESSATHGGVFTNLTTAGIKEFTVKITTLPEQQKIAAFLTSVDTKIEQLGKKKSLLEKYKKGMMQKLFSQALRFKDELGNGFSDWQEKRLIELVATMKSGGGITSADISDSGLYPVYGGNGIRGYTGKYSHDGDYFLIGRQGALCGNINRVTGRAFISEHAIATQGNSYSDTEWLAQKLKFMNLNRLSESSAQPGLSVKKLERIKIKSPSKREQQKIANFFTTFDKKIDLITTELNQAKTFKKGLLQQMFV